MACGCHANGEVNAMSKMIELYKGDSVTRVPEGSKAAAAFLADGFTREKPTADTSGEEDEVKPSGAGSRKRRRPSER